MSRQRDRAPEPSPDDYASADEFRALVLRRTGIAPDRLVCPREKSEMTPCIARDGRLAVCWLTVAAGCVGCERTVVELLAQERER